MKRNMRNIRNMRNMRNMPQKPGRHYAMRYELTEESSGSTSSGESVSSALNQLGAGARAMVHNINGGYGILNRLCALGLVPGTTFQVVRNAGRGPIVLEVHNTRIGISRGQAQKVLVEVLGETMAEEEGQA